MFSRDYLGKLTEALSRTIAALAGFKEKGKFEEGIQEIKSTCKSVLQLDLDALATVPYHQIIQVLKDQRELNNDELTTTASFFSHLADFQTYQASFALAMENYKKALVILRWLQKNDLKNYVIQRDEQIGSIEESIRKIANRNV